MQTTPFPSDFRQCPRCLFTSDIVPVPEQGQCSYCDLHDELDRRSTDIEPILEKIRRKKGKYNCLIGISGGLDSSTMLYAAVKHWGLKPLVIHFSNHWNTEIAEQNMMNLIKKLNIDAITYYTNKEEYDNICRAFLYFGLPDADLANDLAMGKLMYETAVQHKIKYVLNGHCFRTEGSTPKLWTRMDARYLADVYERYTGEELINYPNLTFWDQIKYAMRGITQVRPFHYRNSNKEYLQKEMIEFIGWQSYGPKHAENYYTNWLGSVILPQKFGIDKRIVYVSAQIRSGQITKEEGRAKLNEMYTPALPPMDEFIQCITGEIGDREKFRHYNFKKYKWLLWVLMKIGTIPRTMWVKYCN